MQVTRGIEQTRSAVGALGRVALVPTMGALHMGHLALIRRARELADRVVVSIFVNPAQFGPGEDYERYPRPLAEDLQQCEMHGVDLVFTPEAETIYPPGQMDVTVDVPALTADLEGRQRPGHFAGVCRVVAKLLGIIQPEIACFGLKDYQQLRVIEAMTAGLCLPVRIEPCPTVREADGLACSSRNAYLTAEQRRAALGLPKSLRAAERLLEEGETDPAALERVMAHELGAHHVAPDYAVVRDARTLRPLDLINTELEPVVCLVAGRVGPVRLIDSLRLPELAPGA